MISIRSLSVLGLVLAGCANLDEHKITQADDQQTVALNLGDNIAVELPCNRSTGYSWDVEHQPSTLELLGSPSYALPSNATPGAEGREIFRFRAVSTGSDTLRLVYRRSWERDAAPAKTFSTMVDVH
jgi:inhibitor of cysteine peptidase